VDVPTIADTGNGNPRIVGGTVDLGAYEVQFPAVRSISRTTATPTNAATVAFTVMFNMPATGVDSGDFVLATTGGQSGATISPVSGSNAIWTVTVSTVDAAEGTIGLNLVDDDTIVNTDSPPVPLGGADAGNGDFTGEVYAVDRVAPSVTLSSTAPNSTNASPIAVTVSFSEAVSGFVAEDLGLTNATVSGFSGSGATYTLELTPQAAGPVTVDIAADVASDAAGNGNTAATPFSLVYAPNVPATSHTVFLPMVLRPAPTPAPLQGPDLVVEAITSSDGQLTLTIANSGDMPVNDAFWVDLLIEPGRAPLRVNDTWDALGTRGLSWGVTAPLAPGARLSLTVGDQYYRSDYSRPGGPIAAATLLYAHVDAASTSNPDGGVRESHEVSGGAYNNVFGPHPAASTITLPAPSAAPAALDAGLPTR
jgi:hypothetical protein